jgi:thioredoxin-related protein
MLGRLSLILFIALFLFGCASSNKEAQIEQVVDKYDIYSKNHLEINNQKKAIELLGEPTEKIISILTWNPRNKERNEYVEIWKWTTPTTHFFILFDKKGEFHNKIQAIIMPTNYDKKLLKSLKDFDLTKF